MKKFITVLSILILMMKFSFTQDYKSFISDLKDLKYEYAKVVQTEKTVDVLEDEVEDIHRNVDDLENDVEEYMDQENLIKNNEFINLLNEIKEFNSFTSNIPTCECLHFFNAFLSEFGGKVSVLKQKDNIIVSMAEIGNFKFYYAYSVNEWSYNVTVNMAKKTGWGKFEFGLWGEIEVFDIIQIDENWSISDLTVKINSKETWFNSVKCKNEFPRH
jgi:hypothetical protein